MNKIQTVATAVALSATLGTAFAEDSMNGLGLSPKGLTLAVTGTATLTVPNDEAHMYWQATAQAKTLQEATRQAITTMNEGLEQIKSVKGDLQLQTQNMHSYPVYSEAKGNKPAEIVAWRVSQSLKVTSPDVALVPLVIEKVNGKLALDNLSFSVSHKAKDQYDETLVKMAVKDATQRAAWVAEAVGSSAKNTQLVNLRFEGASMPRAVNMVMRAKAYGDSIPAPDIESGTSTLNMTVTADVLIKN